MRGQLVTSNTMSWKGSGQGQLADANVPDYEKMLHSRYAGSSTGWSSSLNSQYGYPTYSPRSSSGSYMSPSPHRGAYGESRPRSAYLQYQPSKYGLSSEASRYGSLSHLSADFRQLGLESNSYDRVPENGYESESAYRPKPRSGVLSEIGYDLANQARPGTDNRGYASDSGSHHHRRFRQHSREQDSGEFDLETPNMLSNSPPKSPIGDRSLDKSNSDMYMSPTKSQVPMSDFYRYRNDSANSTDSANLNTVSHDDYFKSPPIAKERSVSSNISSHNSIGDLTRWQQHQKQRMDPDEPESEADVSREIIEKSSDLPSNRLSLSHQNKASNSHVVLQRERKVPVSQPYMLQESQDTYDLQERKSDQLETFKNAANAIIQDKDSIIEKQKLRIMDLEETTKEYEMRLRRTLQYSAAAPDTGDSNSFTKLQDLEYKNAALRTELKELKTRKDEEVEALEIKLGGVEHELVQMQTVLRNNQPDMEKIGAKLHEKELEAEEWKNKFLEMKQSHQGLKQKLDGVERYLSDLPTAEEFSKNTEEVLALREENELQKDQIEDLTEKLTESQQFLTEKEITIQELETKQQKLAEKVLAVTKEIQRIKSEGEGKALQQTQEELEQVREEKERLALDLEKAKKLLETNHRRLRQLELKHQNDFRQLEERLLQEEEAVHALREEARLKDEQIQKLKKNIKELASKNQDLMDQNLILKEQIKHMEQQTTDDNQRLQRQLVHEMGICFSELQSLVQICMERAEGKDPNMSLLLGVRSSVMEDDEDETGAVGGDGRRGQREGQTLKQWLSKVKELREEVDRLRSMICNKYAEDLGENINCVVQ